MTEQQNEKSEYETWRREFLAELHAPTSITRHVGGRVIDGAIIFGVFKAGQFALDKYNEYRNSKSLPSHDAPVIE